MQFAGRPAVSVSFNHRDCTPSRRQVGRCIIIKLCVFNRIECQGGGAGGGVVTHVSDRGKYTLLHREFVCFKGGRGIGNIISPDTKSIGDLFIL